MANNDVMVSVIMLCYNHERYIRQALDSVVSQVTNFRYEVIVHDDASTDASASIIAEYAEKYPELIRPILQAENQYSKGILIRRVFIDPYVEGKYIAFCECDDYWTDPNKLQKQVDFLETHPEFTATAHNCDIVDANGDPIPNAPSVYRPYRAHTYKLRRLALGAAFPGQTASLVHRRSASRFSPAELEEAFMKLRIKTGDKRLCLRLLLQGDIYCFEEHMSAHRVVTHGGDSWTARNFSKNLSFVRYSAALDSRRFVKKYFGKFYPNHYMIFHTGTACIIKYFRNRSDQNREVYQQLLAEHGGLIPTCLYLLGLGVISIPLYFCHKTEISRYDP